MPAGGKPYKAPNTGSSKGKGSNPFKGVMKMKTMKPDPKARAFGAEVERMRKEKKERK